MQIGLKTAPLADLQSAVEEIEIAGMACQYIELTGATESVFAAVVSEETPTWYIKLKGANDLAATERARFRAFLESIAFE
jgi:hypothetical protein